MIPDNQTLSSLNHKNPNGTVSVEVSSISADKAILTVKAMRFLIPSASHYKLGFTSLIIASTAS